MSNYDNTNRGILGKNTKKERDSQPDITGSINVEGSEFFLDGWLKQRKDGSGVFYSLSVKRKDRQPGNDSGDSQPRSPGGYGGASGGQTANRDLDDEIPFSPEWR